MEPGFRHYSPRWPLTDYVVGFWSYGQYVQPHKIERLLPTGTMNLTITIDGSTPGATTVSGAHSRYALLDTSKLLSVVAVSFKPGAGQPRSSSPLSAGKSASLRRPIVALRDFAP